MYCTNSNSDGLIACWLDENIPTQVPAKTADGKPFIVLCAKRLGVLRIQALEFAALKKISATAAELQTDTVARREVQYRLLHTKQLLDQSLSQAFDLSIHQNLCWVQRQQEVISHVTHFNSKLSEVCDRFYHQSLLLWNELINRPELTSQGAKARRELIEAMLEHSDEERLGLQGYGSEVAMYCSLLAVAKPLFQFVKKLPPYTLKTKRLSREAQAVLQILQQAQEPDELLFASLPQACGLPPIGTSQTDDGTTAKTLRKKLVQALHEIQTTYDRLLGECKARLYDAFGVSSNEAKLREDLRVRASYYGGKLGEQN